MKKAKPINMIVACSANRVIGKGGKLPWSIPEDWQYFLDKTAGGILIEGRKAYEEFGKALPGRTTIVLTRNPSVSYPDAHTAGSIERALEMAQGMEGAIWIGGGQRIYEDVLPLTDLLYVTEVHAELEGDTFFPEWKSELPVLVSRLQRRDANFGYDFCIYGR